MLPYQVSARPAGILKMPQLQLPMFPVGVTHITALLTFTKEEGKITYFNGSLPVFSHKEEDTQSSRMITAQFCVNGHTFKRIQYSCPLDMNTEFANAPFPRYSEVGKINLGTQKLLSR